MTKTMTPPAPSTPTFRTFRSRDGGTTVLVGASAADAFRTALTLVDLTGGVICMVRVSADRWELRDSTGASTREVLDLTALYPPDLDLDDRRLG